MATNDITLIYNSLNLSIDKLREYNLEKYHFLSGILDILVLHFQIEKAYNLTQDGIYKHFQNHKLNIEKEREKFNTAIAQLIGSDMIAFSPEGFIGLTDKGLEAYDSQLYHNIAASLYAADRSNYFAKVAIISASVLSVISIVSSIIIAIISNKGYDIFVFN